MSAAAAVTPFFTTDQKGSLACPRLTTMMRFSCAVTVVARPMIAAAASGRIFVSFMVSPPYELSLCGILSRKLPLTLNSLQNVLDASAAVWLQAVESIGKFRDRFEPVSTDCPISVQRKNL